MSLVNSLLITKSKKLLVFKTSCSNYSSSSGLFYSLVFGWFISHFEKEETCKFCAGYRYAMMVSVAATVLAPTMLLMRGSLNQTTPTQY